MDEKKLAMARETIKNLEEIEDLNIAENLIQDNKIVFEVDKQEYRVRKPNFKEQTELLQQKRVKYLELVKEKDYLFRKQWVDEYKKKGIDINAMDTQLKTLESEIKQKLLSLATEQDPKEVEILKTEITELRNKQMQISMEKTDLLSYSIEDQLLIYVNGYTLYLILEKKDKENWIKVFKDYKDFEENCSGKLITQSMFYLSNLIYNEA